MPLHARNITCAVLTSCLLYSTSSRATDIQCESTRQPAQRVICDHAILNHEYEDIYEQQQKLIQEGKLTTNNLIAWQQKRDACTDVHCIDGVFAEWSTVDQRFENGPAAPVMNASEALGPASGASPAPPAAAAASEQSSSVPVSRQGSAYGVALPQSISSDASAPVPDSESSANVRTVDQTSSSPLLIVLGVLLAIAALSVGAMIFYQRRRKR